MPLIEVKFRVPGATGERIRAWARARLQADPHGEGSFGDQYRTTTLYFDTAAFDVFHRRNSYGRSKYRIRRYDGQPTVFLERKMRQEGRLAKRRLQVPLADIAQGDTWFARRLQLRGLHPVCQISYNRLARVGSTPHGPLRLTVDDAMQALPLARLEFVRASGTPLVAGDMLVELKFAGPPPALYTQLIDAFGLTPARVSKYRLAVDALGLISDHVADVHEAACPLSRRPRDAGADGLDLRPGVWLRRDPAGNQARRTVRSERRQAP